jgi:transcriptional regulator with XRE-family HTH domain
MVLRKLPHYLRHHRKRLGLLQSDVAFLLGVATGTKVSRYERYARTPTLKTALACEAIFGVPASELFAGIYEKAERCVLTHAKVIIVRIRKRPVGKEHQLRRAWLARLEAMVAALDSKQ